MEYLLTIWKNPTLIPRKKKMLISKSSLITSTSHKVVQNFCYPKNIRTFLRTVHEPSEFGRAASTVPKISKYLLLYLFCYETNFVKSFFLMKKKQQPATLHIKYQDYTYPSHPWSWLAEGQPWPRLSAEGQQPGGCWKKQQFGDVK